MIRTSTCFDTIIIAWSVMELSHFILACFETAIVMFKVHALVAVVDKIINIVIAFYKGVICPTHFESVHKTMRHLLRSCTVC